MGIIVSSFIGCGREYLKNAYGDKIKVFDASQVDLENIVDEVMGKVDENDIVFIPFSKKVRELFNERNIDYDVFYPEKERRGEFIENQVRKRSNPKAIQMLDKNFNKWVDEIEEDENENCYKHKLSHFGEFIGNDATIMQYIDSLKNNNVNTANNNEQS